MPGRTSARIAAVAVTATLAVTGVAGTAHATTRQHTSLSIRSTYSTINAGARDTISGSLHAGSHGVSGLDVALLAKPSGADSFRQIAHHTSGSSGGVSFRVAPTRKTSYELLFRGTHTYAPSRSGVVTVNVRPDTRKPTSLSIRASRSAIDPGGSAVISGVLLTGKTPLGDRDVILQSRPAGSSTWHNSATKKTGQHGYVAFTVKPTTTTAYRLVFTSHPNYRASGSGIVVLHVRTRTALSLTAATTSIEPASSDVLTGTLTTAAGPVANRPVALYDRAQGASSWTKVTSATSDTNGQVSFTVAPTVTTAYRLVHAATQTLTAAASPTVTVTVRKPSSLSIRSKTDTVTAGQSDAITGTLLGQGAGGLAGRSVSLMGRSAGTTDAFTLITTADTDSNGFVSFSVTPTTSTDYELVFNGGNEYDGCHSGVVTVTVA